MASPDVSTSTGTTITFPTSGFSAQILDIEPPNTTCGTIDVSHVGLSAGDSRTKMPSDLIDHDDWTFECHFKPDTTCPVRTAQTGIHIDFPNSEVWTFDGFISGYQPHAPFENKMTATVTIAVDGDIAIT